MLDATISLWRPSVRLRGKVGSSYSLLPVSAHRERKIYPILMNT
jgi:hypothetical protein